MTEIIMFALTILSRGLRRMSESEKKLMKRMKRIHE